MNNRNLNYENAIVKLVRLSRKVSRSIIRIIAERISSTGHIDERAVDIIKKEEKLNEDK